MEELDLSFINTGTVAIFSPEMEGVICVVNDKCGLIVPPGGKYDSTKDRGNILRTVERETREEIGLLLTSESGVWLSKTGGVIEEPELILRDEFVYPNGARGRDFLFFFRLLQKDDNRRIPGQVRGYWFTRQHLVENFTFPMSIDGERYQDYGLIPWSIRSKIIPVMKYLESVEQKPRDPATELFRSKKWFSYGKK